MTNAETALRTNGSKPKAKVKTGCRTCKARRVKCDESFPVCQKCLTTGRICDGYGVWGGGGNQYGRRQVSRSPRDVLSIPPVAGMATLVAGMDEKALFDWFQRRAIVKLPGSYFSDLWTKFILQVSHNEQAVWHAILAVSSTHRVGFVDISSATASELEHSTLQHLSKAVQHLHPHFRSRDKASFTVVLIACIALITLDLLRGHFASAQVHLRNGLNILAEAQYSFHSKACSSDRVLLLSNDSLDSLIAEAFLRLNIQVELLQNPGRPRPCLLAPHLQPSLVEVNHSTPQFSSYIAVWHSLGRLINDVFHLSTHVHEHQTNKDDLTIHQKHVARALKTWLKAYNDSLPTLQLFMPQTITNGKARVHHLVLSYHIMLTIMMETIIHRSKEMIFDNHTHNFTELINHLSKTYELSSPDLKAASNFSTAVPHRREEKCTWVQGHDMAHTIIDFGWFIPLFYVAVKCRNRDIRHQAVRLLQLTTHREGFWDGKVTACIARRVVDVEEGDFYNGCDDNTGPTSSTNVVEPGLTLPESSRIRDLEVQMSGNPLEKVLLYGVFDGIDDNRVCIGEYHVLEQRWV
ncbi:hypothetical protein ASPSYDRAFT_293446 [Aspergillus sydowii CBS 593.65]|uniref:Zn(2)-C6 fungal-type domain-containing protein n=1 Tax=Aspergillus sydowii CBS 593.65 TaxID=1036612 RepID=A0A1L9TXJ5_9EURO|nr:uncharacterized protein ASPSYDRAFT_293446 [Aspergillus sydowii CBS 593.65]OJJ64146.1 hypothetical protein ASPSYDRAFT_293446 [Aspergillus sydowii CBS 593.65]